MNSHWPATYLKEGFSKLGSDATGVSEGTTEG